MTNLFSSTTEPLDELKTGRYFAERSAFCASNSLEGITRYFRFMMSGMGLISDIASRNCL